jgi:hypothetical protein
MSEIVRFGTIFDFSRPQSFLKIRDNSPERF